MISRRTPQQLSQQRFVVLLIGVEAVVVVLFCAYVRYDDSLNPVKAVGQLDREHPPEVRAHEDNYPRKFGHGGGVEVECSRLRTLRSGFDSRSRRKFLFQFTHQFQASVSVTLTLSIGLFYLTISPVQPSRAPLRVHVSQADGRLF